MKKQIPTLKKWVLEHQDLSHLHLRFEFWATGKFTEEGLAALKEALTGTGIECASGPEALVEAASRDADCDGGDRRLSLQTLGYSTATPGQRELLLAGMRPWRRVG